MIKVTKAGKVTIVKTFDKTCKTLSKQTKDTIKKVSTKVTMSVPATTNYKAASTSVTVTINKKPVRVFSTYDSINKYSYPSKSPLSPGFTNYKKLTDLKWTIVDKYQMPGLAPTADEDWTKIIFSVTISVRRVSAWQEIICLRQHTVWMICTTAAFSFTTTRRANF